jgi:hypothetical protein
MRPFNAKKKNLEVKEISVINSSPKKVAKFTEEKEGDYIQIPTKEKKNPGIFEASQLLLTEHQVQKIKKFKKIY